MRIAVCDDENAIRNEIVRLVREQHPEAEIEAFASGEELVAAQDAFSIYFLDIAMGGMSGMEAAKIIRAKQEQSPRSIIIFITGYREYMEAAFDVNAYHYLVKPISEVKFHEVFCRAWKDAKSAGGYMKRKILVKSAGNSRSVWLKNIYYVESSNKKVVFHTAQGEFEAYAKMAGLEAELGGAFYRCHRGYLVNMAHIAEYNNESIKMNGGESILMSKERYNGFVKAYMRYLQNGGVCHV